MLLHSCKWSDAGQHAHDVLDGAHFLDLLQLIAKVLQRKAIAAQCPRRHLLRFFLVHILFGALNERKNVAHPKDARNDTVRMERFKSIVFLADADKLYWLASDLANGQRRAAASVPVHLC